MSADQPSPLGGTPAPLPPIAEVALIVDRRVNLALQQNDVPTVKSVTVRNRRDQPLRDVVIRIEADPDFAIAWEGHVQSIGPNQSYTLEDVDLLLSPRFLVALTERTSGLLHCDVFAGGAKLCAVAERVELFAYDEWSGADSLPEILAAFVLPNHPAVEALLGDARRLLRDSARHDALDGYGSGRRQTVLETVGAIYEAVRRQRIGYIRPPAGFETAGQKIRTPDRVLGSKLGTCLDLATLLAACLEQAGLHPLLVLIDGHALVGCWLDDQVFPTAAFDDGLALRKRVDLHEIVVFETTTLTGEGAVDFAAATKVGRRHLDDPSLFRCAVDVVRARRSHVRPIVGRVSDQGRFEPIAVAREVAGAILPEVPIVSEATPSTDGSEAPATRLDRWRRKLLDLSLRNRLLNFRPTKKTIPFLCPDLASFEDQLANGAKFQVLPRPQDLGPEDPRSEEKARKRVGEEALQEVLVRDLSSKRLRADLDEKQLDLQMIEIYRAAKLAEEESGTSALYAALGFLRWLPKGGAEQPRLAPILLVPIEVSRPSIQHGFRLGLGGDEPRINVTLLQMLRQDFDLDIAGLDPLPRDDSGIDVKGVLAAVRLAIRDVSGWDVTDACHLGFFSFTKFLMWRDLQERAGELLQSPVVKHLVHHRDAPFDPGAPMPRTDRLDGDRAPLHTFCPLSADSSQLQAVFAGADGRSFVLHGPPGTGKSQTIANIIAQCFAQQKTVLFVAEKTVALDVVHRRLESAGLGEFCLELHSSKAKKSDVIKQIGDALDRGVLDAPPDWESKAKRLGDLRADLNAYVEALHAPVASGESAFQGMSSLIRWQDAPDVGLRWSSADAVTAAELAKLRACVERIGTYAEACGELRGHAWADVHHTRWSPERQREIETALTRFESVVDALRTSARDVASALGLSAPTETREQLAALALAVATLRDPPPVPLSFFLEADWVGLRARVSEWIEHGVRRDALRARMVGVFRDAILSADVPGLVDAARRALGSWAPVAWIRSWNLRRKLRPMLHAGASLSHAELLPRLSEVLEFQREQSVLERASGQARSVLGHYWNDSDAEWGLLSAASAMSTRLRDLALRIAEQDPSRASLLRAHWGQLVVEGRSQLSDGGALALRFQRFEKLWKEFQDVQSNFAGLLDMPVESLAPSDPATSVFDHVEKKLSRFREAMPELRLWCQWQAVRVEAVDAGLAPLIEAIEQGRVTPQTAKAAFEKGYYRFWASAVVSADPRLCDFHSAEHTRKIEAFREADDAHRRRAIEVLRAELSRRVQVDPAAVSRSPEVGVVRKESQKKRNHIPVRALLGRSGNLITRLKPCFLMSPISVAQYLDPAFPPFDVVIFDEASQIPVWDAVGAMARAKSAIVVGDPKQLPPTNFFGRGEEEEENTAGDVDLEDLESILDDCLASGLPQLHLRWHYRSRHESLIAFSNHHYYENRLLTFPSPETRDSVGAGVSFRYVPDGVYDKGLSRTNVIEARALVNDVVARLREGSKPCSIGIVAFNQQQRTLIEDLLEQERRAHPEIEPHFAEDAEERLFVKNLENVQGDERDTIYFSVGFGRDAAGKVGMNFGPMNRDGGERRLNVAITRARERVIVYASIRSEHIDLARTQARGVRDLKTFLRYAEHGVQSIAEITQYKPVDAFDSPFEQKVCQRIREAGWDVHVQVGCSGYRIDLAVVDPERPGRYLLGIECDGASYHSAATARDRDKLRAAVLEGLGWRLHRVWSTDWWQQPDRELQKIMEALDMARRET